MTSDGSVIDYTVVQTDDELLLLVFCNGRVWRPKILSSKVGINEILAHCFLRDFRLVDF